MDGVIPLKMLRGPVGTTVGRTVGMTIEATVVITVIPTTPQRF
jgi:hypothetical protein